MTTTIVHMNGDLCIDLSKRECELMLEALEQLQFYLKGDPEDLKDERKDDIPILEQLISEIPLPIS